VGRSGRLGLVVVGLVAAACASEPAPGPGFGAVSVGGSHSCWLRDNGTVVCWGFSLHGQSDPPGGVFSAVSAGDYVFTFIGFMGLAIPNFLFALILLWITFEATGTAASRPASTENASAPLAGASHGHSLATIGGGRPVGTNESLRCARSTTPVKARSMVCALTERRPLAGSFK